MKLQALLLVALLGPCEVAAAQEILCPQTGIPISQDPGCVTPNHMGSAQQVQQPPPPPQPTGWWKKTWGAIAPSPVGGVLGTATGAKSKEDAEQIALEDCKAKGGGGCKVLATYFNQCGAMALGAERIFTASAGSEAAAGNEAVKYCEESEGANAGCRVYYSACTEPIFHKYTATK